MRKILDATAVIAFLKELDYPAGIAQLSEHYEVMIPEGVQREITKSPGREMLQDLVEQGAVRVVGVDQMRVTRLRDEYPQLHMGECEVIVLMQTHPGMEVTDCAVSDDH